VLALGGIIVSLSDGPVRRSQVWALNFIIKLSQKQTGGGRRKTDHQTLLKAAIPLLPPGDYHPVQRLGRLVRELVSSGTLDNSDWKHMDRSH
jgi:hypothetical protein